MNTFRLATALLVLAVVSFASFAEDTNTLPTMITVDGIIYSNVTWHTVTPATVTIYHQVGVASIPLEKLPPELQQRFGYDPQKAATYQAEDLAAAQQRVADTQARERLRQQREAEAAEAERRQQQAQEEQARQQLAAIQRANANADVEVIPVLGLAGPINLLDSGAYVAQVALSNQTTICAHFDEGGKRYLEDASRKYADWKTQQESGGQQLQVPLQPGTILLYGGRNGVVRVPGGGFGLTYSMGAQPTPTTSPPVATVYAVREENSSCYLLKGNREAGQTGGVTLYVWQ
jgi:DNA segregation ATPase FtsK/SpoIIIE-like protein